MSRLVDSATQYGLRLAAQRWPESIRAASYDEWRAELAVIQTEPGVGAWTRNFRALRFAASLARSRVTETPETWPELVTRVGRANRPTLLLLAVPFLAFLVWSGFHHTVANMISLVRPASGTEDMVSDFAISLVSLPAVGIVLGVLGWIAAGRLPLMTTADRSVRALTAVVLTPILTGAGMAIFLLTPMGTGYNGNLPPVALSPTALPAVLLFALGLGIVGLVACRLVARGHHRWAIAATVVGSGLMLWAVSTVALASTALAQGFRPVTAPLWLPAVLTAGADGETFGAFLVGTGEKVAMGGQLAAEVDIVVRLFLLTALFAVPYMLRHGRTTVSGVRSLAAGPAVSPALVSPAAEVALVVGERRRSVMAALAWLPAVVGIAVWVDMLTVGIRSAPAIEAAAQDAPDSVHLWLHDIRQAALLLTGLGLVFALRHFRAAVPAGVVVTGVLLTLDLLIDRVNAEGWLVALLVGTLAAVAVVAARLVARSLGTAAPSADVRASRYTWFAIVAGFCAPAPLLNFRPWALRAMPMDLVAGLLLATVGLAVFASACAIAARRAEERRGGFTAWVVPVVLAVLIILVMLERLPEAWSSAVAVVGPPMAAYLYAVSRFRGGRGWRTPIQLLVFAVVAVVAIPVGVLLSFSFAGQLAPTMMLAAGYTFPADGLPYVIGAITVGVFVAFVATTVKPRFSLRRMTRLRASRSTAKTGLAGQV